MNTSVILNDMNTNAILNDMNANAILNETTINNLDSITKQFAEADPFRHVLIKDFLNKNFLENILKDFPKPDSNLKNEFGSSNRKHAVHKIRSLGENFVKWDDFVKSEGFISYLEKITGIQGLIYDPEYHGAGTHNNLDGQGMDVHIDFNLHRTTGLHRRLNLIIYLNENWHPDWGGSIEVHKNPWDIDNNYWHTYPCLCNHAILFETNEYSWHGFEKIKLPADKKHLSRKSLTVYYYTKERPAKEIAPKHGTVYVQKSIPKEICPGQVITEKMYNDLKAIFQHRNCYLKGLYRRESNLLVRIAGMEHRLKQYQENFRLLSIGDAIQDGIALGILPNGKVESCLNVKYHSQDEISHITIMGHIPQFLESNSINVSIGSLERRFANLAAGGFKLELDVDIQEDQRFEIKLESENSYSPFEKNISNDKQKVGFILGKLEFY